MAYSHKIYLQQVGLKRLGFDPGPLDGFDGRKTQKAYKASLSKRYSKTSSKAAKANDSGYPPAPNPQNKIRVFGPHGIKGGFTPKMGKVSVPWEMSLSWDKSSKVRSIRCHHLIVKPLQDCLNELYSVLGKSGIKKYGLNLWAGCYNPRRSRGGSSMSDHAWAIANDWNPDANGNRQSWTPDKKMPNGTYQFSRKVVSIFRKYGFQVGFKTKNGGRRDMMHVAYVNRT